MARSTRGNKKTVDVTAGAVPAEALGQAFPAINLPITPPYPPAEARPVDDIPSEPGWLYEPKWDGFRCLAFRSGDEVVLQSKAGQPLGRYFPEILEALKQLPARKFVLDGEIIIRSGNGLDFDALLQRIHPAASRIRKLAQETPATYLVFDLLVTERGKPLVDQPLSARRMELQHFAAPNFQGNPRVHLSPAASDFETAQRWMQQGAAHGLDGIVAKRLDCEYTSGERTGMVKIKRMRTADCVVGGFRWAQKGGEVGSLLLGVYNHDGQLDHIGFSSSFSKEARTRLKDIVKPLIAKESGPHAGFNGKAPGGPSRWAREDRNTEWFPLKHKLVGEFQYDHFSGGRFRHGTKFLRWRPDKKPEQCGMDQVKPGESRSGWKEFGL
ncbi:MAG TPA: ATP-dependent DNA ligase [Candidatus Angelobacter sp.]|nr:ATP-dependent DNA ligase [Candidatus Angelobacter sp.]